MSPFNIRIIPLTFLCLLLSACGSNNLNLPQPQPVVVPVQQTTGEEQKVPESIYHPLKTADTPKRLEEAYDLALNLYKQGQYQEAKEALGGNILNTASKIQFKSYLLAASIESNLDNIMGAFTLLDWANQLPAARHPDNQNLLNETRATVLEDFGNWLEVVNIRMELAYNLPLDEGYSNQEKLWQAVQNLTQSQVEELYLEQEPILTGWLNISSILNNQSLSIEQQLAEYDLWRSDNPSHPAAITPPLDFRILAKAENMAPKTVVLMLPMSGKLERASRAILDGFFTTFYNQQHERAEVFIVDTDSYSSIDAALSVANAKQPDVIIGPLQKSNVARISLLDLPYPVIALNQLDIINQHPKNLYHFSLNAEDEINELITFAKQEGATKSAILSTQDGWALKQSDEFRNAAEKYNVSITSQQAYANTPKGRQTAIQKLLLVDESYNRKGLIEKWTGSKVESIARSRKDLDYVYYVGKLNDAKQIRPLLDFYFADQIPMLASSTLNDTQPDKSIKAEDIERILFTEIPALTQKNNILVKLKNDSNILRRLQAFGADAYLLANRYQLFTLLPSTRISANTGILTIDEDRVFHKRPEIMTYRKGRLVYATSNQFFAEKEETEK